MDRRHIATLMLPVLLSACGGGGSQGSNAPRISQLFPSPVFQSAAAQKLQILGSNFTQSSVADWNGKPLPTTYIAGGEVDAVLPVTDVDVAGTGKLTVVNPPADGGTSNEFDVVIRGVSPSVTALSPSSVKAGAAGYTLTITGNEFMPGSVAFWTGKPLSTKFISANEVQAQVSASDIATIQTAVVFVENPGDPGVGGGGDSRTLHYPVGYGLTVLNVTSNSIVWNPVQQVIYASVPASDSRYPNSIVTIDPTTGKIVSSQATASNPDVLAISGDEQFLYVGIDGGNSSSPSVQRFLLPSMTLDISWSLGSNAFGPLYPLDIEVAPGAPHTTAIATGTLTGDPRATGGITIYDDSTPRPNSAADGVDLYGSIQWGANATEVYASNTDTSQLDFYRLNVDSNGITLNLDFMNKFQFVHQDGIHYDSGTNLIYSNDGMVIDPTGGAEPVSGLYLNGTEWFAAVPETSKNMEFDAICCEDDLSVRSQDLSNSQNYSMITVPIATFFGGAIVGHMIRWGTDGLAVNFAGNGQVYIISGQFVN